MVPGAQTLRFLEPREARQLQALVRRRGRRTSSPRQFGHTYAIATLHFSQKVHSYVQMNPAASTKSTAPHRSQLVRISRDILVVRAPNGSRLSCGALKKDSF